MTLLDLEKFKPLTSDENKKENTLLSFKRNILAIFIGLVTSTCWFILGRLFAPFKECLTKYPLCITFTAIIFLATGGFSYRIAMKKIRRKPRLKTPDLDMLVAGKIKKLNERVKYNKFGMDVYEAEKSIFIGPNIYCPKCGSKLDEREHIFFGSTFYCPSCRKKYRSKDTSAWLRYYAESIAENKLRHEDPVNVKRFNQPST